MNRIKTGLLKILLIGLVCALACGCARTQTDAEKDETLNIYATFYPLYACAAMITDGVPDINLQCLVQPQDGCLRNYALSDWDYSLLARSADVIIAGGRGLESFDDALYTLGDDGPVVAYVLYNMELKENPGTQDIGVESESHWLDANPHIYMSTEGMMSIAESICAQLSVVDPDHSALYAHNLEKANNRLESLSTEMQEVCENPEGKNVVLANEALVSFAEEFGLNVETVIDRDSGEAFYDTELQECLDRLQGCAAEVLLIEQQAPQSFVEALESAGFTVVRINILSSCSSSDGSDAYFDAQAENAAALAKALLTESEEEAA